MTTSLYEHILSSDDEPTLQPQSHQPSQIPDTPLFPFNLFEYLKNSLILFKSGLPTAIAQIGTFLTGLVCLRFVGKYSDSADELAGASLGFTWTNVFCLGILASINQGFGVFAAQLHGGRKYREVGILLQRNLCVITVVMVPLLLSLYFADVMLIQLGLKYEVSINTGIFLKNVIPSLVGLAYFECMRNYLMAQGHFTIQPIIQGTFAIIHIFWCYFLVDLQGMQAVRGVAIAKSITDMSSMLIVCLYIKYKNTFKESWIPWDKECLTNWGSHLKSTLTIGANLYVEWISYEVSLFIVGAMNNEFVLAAHGLAVTVIAVLFVVPYGNSLSMQAHLGNSVGEGSVNKAQRIVASGLGINMILSSINVFIFLFWLDEIPDFFTDDIKTKDALKHMIVIYAIAHIPDTFVNHITGVLRSVGKEKEVLLNFCICYPLISINCEWIFGIALGYGYIAVWVSIAFGMYLMLALMIRKFIMLDWKGEIGNVRSKVVESQESTKYIEMQDVV